MRGELVVSNVNCPPLKDYFEQLKRRLYNIYIKVEISLHTDRILAVNHESLSGLLVVAQQNELLLV